MAGSGLELGGKQEEATMAGSARGQPSWATIDWQRMLPLAPNWSRPFLSGGPQQAAGTTTATIKRMHELRHKRRQWRRSSKSESIASIASDNENNDESNASSSSLSRGGGNSCSCIASGDGCIRWWNNNCETRDGTPLLPVSARAISQDRPPCGPRSGADKAERAPTAPSMTTQATSALSSQPSPLAAPLALETQRSGRRRTRRPALSGRLLGWPTEFRGAPAAKLAMLLTLALALPPLFQPAGRSLATMVSAAELATQNEPGERLQEQQQQQQSAAEFGAGRVAGANSTQQQQSPLSAAAGPLSLANESRLVKAALSSVMSIEPISALQSNVASNSQKHQDQLQLQRQQLQQQRKQFQMQQHQQRQHQQPTNLAATGSISDANLTGSDSQQQELASWGANMPIGADSAEEFALQQQAIRANENVAEEYSDLERYVTIGVIILDIVIFIIGFCGNTVVILVILKFTKVKSVTDVYILNLAFADLMFLTGLLFLMITMFIGRWIFGALMCKLYMATTSLNQFASSLLLVVMSFDRFLAVCHPFYAQRFRQIRRAKVICLCIWIICWILMTPILTFARIDNSRANEMTCTIIWPEHESINCDVAFTLYSFTIGFAGPLSLIAIFHLCVIRRLRLAASGRVSVFSTSHSRMRETTNRRVEHLVIGIICTYTICWLPYWIGQLGVSFTIPANSPVQRFWCLYLVATSLEYFNSAVNPILYAFLSDDFKRRCSDIVTSCAKWWLIFREVLRGNGYNGYNDRGDASHHQLGVTSTTLCYELEPTEQVEYRATSATPPNNRGGDGGSLSLAEKVSKGHHRHRRQQRRISSKSTAPFAAGANNGNGTENTPDCNSSGRGSNSSSDYGFIGLINCFRAAGNSNNNSNAHLAKTSSNLAPTNNAASPSAAANQTYSNLLLQPAPPSQPVAPSLPNFLLNSQGEASTHLMSSATLTQSSCECLASSNKNLAAIGACEGSSSGSSASASGGCSSGSGSGASGSGSGASGSSSTGSCSNNSSSKMRMAAVVVAETTIDPGENQRKKGVAFSSIDTVVVHTGLASTSSNSHLTIQQQQQQQQQQLQQLQQREKGDGGQCQDV